MGEILVATNNPHKIPEIIENLDLPGWRYTTLGAMGLTEIVEETGATYEENARIKAQAAWLAERPLAVLADDSGLEVDALGGAPGVHSARYAGERAADIGNVEKLLDALKDVPWERRTARFVCTIVFIDEKGVEIVSQGTCEGVIALEPRGTLGFGYDPVFLPDEETSWRTMAELTSEEKNRISHRGRALQDLRQKLLAHYEMIQVAPEASVPVASAPEVSAPAPQAPITAVEEAEPVEEIEPVAEAESVAEAEPVTEAEPIAEASVTEAEVTAPIPVISRLSPQAIVAFDFDGTLLEGHSPVRMLRRLTWTRVIPLRIGFKILGWGIRYRFHRPVEQKEVREYIFSAFTHVPVEEANRVMSDFYHDDLRRRLRPKALEVFGEHKAAGDVVVLVSASFLPILREVAPEVGADWFICTQMEVVDGHYTSNVAHTPPEGEQKLIQLRDWADTRYGEDGWELVVAYGDHRSDAPLLASAKRAVAVNPDSGLERIARSQGWQVVDWSFKV